MTAAPGTISDLVSDAAAAGYVATPRLIRDWSEIGLLDYPSRRPAGKGHGSRPALYPPSQRQLFQTLLLKRSEGSGPRALAKIPVAIWVYWGDEWVPLRQVRRAMRTWLGDPRLSKRQARQTAREILRQFDDALAAPAARRELLNVLTETGYTGRADFEQLETALRRVFEPGSQTIRKAVGHPEAPIMTDSFITALRARLTGASRLEGGEITDEEFYFARHVHLVAYADYAMHRHSYAALAPEAHPDMYEEVTADRALNEACLHLLTTIGMNNLNPDSAQQFRYKPTPRIRFQIPQVDTATENEKPLTRGRAPPRRGTNWPFG
jgi:hypothetical protein